MIIKIVTSEKKNNKSSLALQVYQHGIYRQFKMKMFIYTKPTNRLEKDHNISTMLIAEQVKAKRILEIQESNYNIYSGFKSQANFLDYFYKLARERKYSEGNYGNWISAYRHLKKFTNGKTVRFCDCDENFVNGFKTYLQTEKITKSNTRLSVNSTVSYLNKLKAALSQAFNEKMILDNPGKRVKGIKPEENEREYLVKEEIQTLFKTPCVVPLLKRAFLFSCLTGLRWSDINKLIWKEITYVAAENKWRITFTQKKTKGLQYNPINEKAYNLLGERGDDDERVFKGLKYSAWNNSKLSEWIYRDAGIKKKISFHSGRHSYSCLLLTSGVDIYTVSSLLGHKDIKTTQIYAHIINKTKNDAVDLLPEFELYD